MGELIAYKDEAPFGRRRFSLSIPDLDSFPSKLPLPSPHFVLLLACDACGIENSAIATFASSVIEQGAAYVCAWGPDCERVHDIFDEVHVRRNINEEREYPHVVTTWHDDESLDEALWYMLNSTYPDEAPADKCLVDLAVSVASDQWAAHVEKRLSNLSQLNEDVLGEEAN